MCWVFLWEAKQGKPKQRSQTKGLRLCLEFRPPLRLRLCLEFRPPLRLCLEFRPPLLYRLYLISDRR